MPHRDQHVKSNTMTAGGREDQIVMSRLDSDSALERQLGQPLPRRVVVLRALQLGDMLCAVPALRALRAALPEAEIVLAGLPWAHAFVRRFNRYLDGFLEFPGYPGLPERSFTPAAVTTFLADAQAEHFDLALQIHGSGAIVNPLLMLLGARLNAGFYMPGQYCPDESRFLPYPEGEPEVWRHLRLMEHLGIPLQGDTLEFPLSEDDLHALAGLRREHGLRPGRYVCVHPGARGRTRRWPVERFAAVADALAARGLQVVLTGTAVEAELTAAVRLHMRRPAVDLAGRTTLGALGALLRDARLLVCNDTGISHVAAALGVPSVVIFTASDPRRWAPQDTQLHRAVLVEVACRPCGYAECPIGHVCALGVTPDAVLAEVDALLRRPRLRAVWQQEESVHAA